jgi:triphosphatase
VSAVRAKRRGAAAVHAEPLALDPALSGDAALQQIGLACLDHMLRNEPAVLAGIDDGIHQMRVAVRRLRAILSAFGKLLPENQRQWASEELRWLADALGPARNLDVFETALLKPAGPDVDASAGALEQLRQAAHHHRRLAHREAAEAVRSMRYIALKDCLHGWFEHCGWREGGGGELRQPVCGVAEQVLHRQWRVARKRGKAFATQSPNQRHRLRIALKKLRYTAESLATLYPPGETELFIKRLKRLQDDLGQANDVRVGREILAELAPPAARQRAMAEAGQRVLAWHEDRLAKSEPKLREHLHKLLETDPFWRR